MSKITFINVNIYSFLVKLQKENSYITTVEIWHHIYNLVIFTN